MLYNDVKLTLLASLVQSLELRMFVLGAIKNLKVLVMVLIVL